MCSPGGALGMTMNERADLSNLTYSLMEVEHGDFVFLTTDGISDNYDPCVSGAASSVKTPLLARKSSHTLSQTPLMLMDAYQRHLASLRHMCLAIAARGIPSSAFDLCQRLVDGVVRLTDEQRRTIEQGVRENKDVEGVARRQFENDMRVKVGKIPGKLDHASIVVYQIV